jgi:hypothetical protein
MQVRSVKWQKAQTQHRKENLQFFNESGFTLSQRYQPGK